MPEHRSQPRVESQNLVSIEYVDKEGSATEFMGRSLDLSETGIQVETNRAYPNMSVLSLSLCIGEDILKVKGRVVHAKGTKDGRVALGIRFLDLTDKDSKTLKNYLSEREAS